MVVYEVLSLHIPFYQYRNMVIPGKVVQGDRPERPEGGDGVPFTDDVWKVLGRCWVPEPGDRPRIENVLRCMEESSTSWVPPSRQLFALHSASGSFTSFQTKTLLQAQMLVGYLPPLVQPRLSRQRNLSEGTLQEPLIRFVGKVRPPVPVSI